MGILSFMAGNSSAASKVLDAGIAGIDKLVLTDEERLDFNRKTQETYLEIVRITATESTAQSISRRMICLPVVYTWLILVVLSALLSVIGAESAEAVGDAVDTMSIPALASIGFYVGRHMITKGKS